MPTFIKLKTPLPASAACERLFSAAGWIFVPRRGRISDKRFEQQLLAYSNNCICCNDSRHCHAKDVILMLHGYRPRRVIKVLLECMSTFYFYLLN